MKKSITVALLCLLVCAFVFASDHNINVQVSPYSYQHIGLRVPAEYKSDYGWGLKAGYRFHYSEVGEIGADFSFSDYKYSSDTSNRYLVYSLLVNVGTQIKITKAMGLDIDFGAGAEIRNWKSVTNVYPVFGCYVGLSYAVSPMVDLTAGTDLRIGWQDNNNSFYSSNDFDVICNLGARINL